MEDYRLHFAKTAAEIALFWERRDRYMREDILPNCSFDPPTDEDWQWFFSAEYKDHIMDIFHNGENPLEIVFLEKDGEHLGFSSFITYLNEDGKCIIIEFCVNAAYRNAGVGGIFFDLIKKHAAAIGATYFSINLSNEDNERFWLRQGFAKSGQDEHGDDVYSYPIHVSPVPPRKT